MTTHKQVRSVEHESWFEKTGDAEAVDDEDRSVARAGLTADRRDVQPIEVRSTEPDVGRVRDVEVDRAVEAVGGVADDPAPAEQRAPQAAVRIERGAIG